MTREDWMQRVVVNPIAKRRITISYMRILLLAIALTILAWSLLLGSKQSNRPSLGIGAVLRINLNLIAPTAAEPVAATPTATPSIQFRFVTPNAPPPASAPSQVIEPENAQRLIISAIPGKGHVKQIAWSADRSLMAVASSTGIWLYQRNALDQPGQLLQGYPGGMDSIVFSPKGDLMASVNDTFPYPAGSRGANAKRTVIVLWDRKLASAKGVLSGLSGGHRLAFSPDEKTLATANLDMISLWDIRSGLQRLTWRNTAAANAINTSHTATAIGSLAFSPDGTLLASGDPDNVVRLWDPKTGSKLGEFVPPTSQRTSMRYSHFWTGISTLAFSGDGKTLVSGGGDNYVRVWDVQTGVLHASRADAVTGVTSVDISSDGNAVAYLGDTAWLWQFKTNIAPAFLDKSTQWRSLVFSADDIPLALGIKDGMWHWWGTPPNPQKGVLIGYNFEHVEHIAFNPDGQQLALADGGIQLLNLTNNQLRSICRDCADGMIFSPSGQFLGTAPRWKPDWWNIARAQTDLGQIFSAGFSPDGSLLASAGSGNPNQVILWDVQSAKPRSIVLQSQNNPRAAPCGVAFSPDGSLLAYAVQNTTTLWGVHTGQVRKTMTGVAPDPESSNLNSPRRCALRFSSDGRVLAASFGKAIALWQVDTGQQTAMLQGHTDTVANLAFSPDGRLLASSTSNNIDETIRLWDVTSGQQKVILQAPYFQGTELITGAITSIAFSPNGRTLASADKNGVIYFWQVAG
jgi:WD40 repeat protein